MQRNLLWASTRRASSERPVRATPSSLFKESQLLSHSVYVAYLYYIKLPRLSVCLSAFRMTENVQTDFHETFHGL